MILHYIIYLHITSFLHVFEVEAWNVCIFYIFHLDLFAYDFRAADKKTDANVKIHQYAVAQKVSCLFGLSLWNSPLADTGYVVNH